MIAATSMASLALIGCTTTESKGDLEGIGRITEFADSSRQFTPEMMWKMGRIGGFQLSADALKAVYGVTYYSVEKNKSRSVIYSTAPLSEEEPVLLTSETSSEYSPSFIPGTDKVAYLAADQNEVMQLWMMNVDGSSRKQISFEASDVNDYLFSPCGKKVILVKTINKVFNRMMQICQKLQVLWQTTSCINIGIITQNLHLIHSWLILMEKE